MTRKKTMAEIKTLQALAFLQLAYTRDLSEEQLDFYVEMLRDIDPAILETAVRKLIQTSKFLPTIAEIRSAAATLEGLACGTAELDADEAWGQVQRAIRSVGYNARPEFDSEALMETVNSLGWQEICMTPVEDTPILRAQFRRAYEQNLARRAEKKEFRRAIIQGGNQKKIAGAVRMLKEKMNMNQPGGTPPPRLTGGNTP